MIVEKADGVGGTWRHNTYPGCECDIQSHLYSFSFEPKSDWSKPYGIQPEILAYLEQVAEKYDLLPHCRFGNGAVGARWDEEASTWRVALESGETLEADVVVSAVGMFNELAWPDIEGIDDFEGPSFHSIRWDHSVDITGTRFALVGAGASGFQIAPTIADRVGHLSVFQRTAQWMFPNPNYHEPTDTPDTLDYTFLANTARALAAALATG